MRASFETSILLVINTFERLLFYWLVQVKNIFDVTDLS